ncbi:uncharacterized protein LOC127839913 isoform X2 [Dreissena polymorpha]|uniref:uncharacterized protein LOC127839913 isoform X2 n=1 Tax=Dreissena polymorpha TaxID=45954 RepID=UPI002264212C|nr:uncharacterized protein LOC127839913 isoform X2 [Dreissena polymorpha]
MLHSNKKMQWNVTTKMAEYNPSHVMSSSVNGQYKTLPSINIGGFDVRFISLKSDSLAYLPESVNTDYGRLLFLGSDLLPVLGTFVLRSNQVRVHQRFAKIGLATRRYLKGFKVSGVPNSKVIYFYSIQGVFRVVFEFGSNHMQRDCLQKLAQPWLSAFDEPLLQPDGEIAFKSDALPNYSSIFKLSNKTEVGQNTQPPYTDIGPKTQPLHTEEGPNTQPIHTEVGPNTKPLHTEVGPNTQPLHTEVWPNTKPLYTKVRPNNQPLRTDVEQSTQSLGHSSLPSENRNSDHAVCMDYLDSFEVKDGKPKGRRMLDLSEVCPCPGHNSSDTQVNGKNVETYKTIVHTMNENIGHLSVHQPRIAHLHRTCIQYIQYVLKQPSPDSMLVLFHIMEEFMEHQLDGADIRNHDSSYGMDENHFSLMCIMCTKVGEEFNKVRPFIKQKADTFKQENLLRLNELPSSIEIIDQLFPSFMVSLVVNWVRETQTACERDHTYTEGEGGADLDIQREAKQVQLILELCTGSLISSLAHLVQYQCSKQK